MSWSIDAVGTRAGVRRAIDETFDPLIAGQPDGTINRREYQGAKDQAVLMLDALEQHIEDPTRGWNGVRVAGSGSVGYGGNIALQVSAIRLFT